MRSSQVTDVSVVRGELARRSAALHARSWDTIMGDILDSRVPVNAVAQPQAQDAAPQPIGMLPFIASTHEHTEPAFDITLTPGAAVVNPSGGQLDIPAAGYVRSIFLEISGSGGTGGTIAADGPWNLLQSIGLNEVNSSTIINPIDGYALYLANVVGGYAYTNDPAQAPFHVGSAPNPVFFLRVPVEIAAKDGLGSLVNQNAAAQYKLSLALNTLAAAFSVAPSPVPAMRIRGWLEAWTLPADQDMRGRPQAQTPPLVGTGQYWSHETRSVFVGANTQQIRRVGNYIRALVFVARNGSGVRDDTVFPDPMRFNWDGNMQQNASQRYLQQYFREKVNGPFTRPAGVFVLPFNHVTTGRMGNEDPSLWLPTTDSSRLEIEGNSATAGTIQIITCEVAPVEINQAQRYEVPNMTGAVR